MKIDPDNIHSIIVVIGLFIVAPICLTLISIFGS